MSKFFIQPSHRRDGDLHSDGDHRRGDHRAIARSRNSRRSPLRKYRSAPTMWAQMRRPSSNPSPRQSSNR